LPFCRAWASSARTRSRKNLSFELGEDGQQSGHGATSGRSQIESFGERHEADAQIFKLLERCQQISHGSAPAIKHR
jgi:hypothetical protein